MAFLPAAIIPSLIGATVAVGTSVYASRQADKAADKQARIANSNKRERMEIEQANSDAGRERAKGENKARNMLDDEAANAQMGAMNRAAEGEKYARDQEKLLAAQQAENQYASKFKPGQGGLGEDSASDFLVPKVADDTGLVRQANDKGGNGLIAQLGFGG